MARRPIPFSPRIGRTGFLGSIFGILMPVTVEFTLLSVPSVSHRDSKSALLIPTPSSLKQKQSVATIKVDFYFCPHRHHGHS